jgi:hypothetical protein
MTMPNDSRPHSSESARRAALHRVIGALQKQLQAIGCAHFSTCAPRGYCTQCMSYGAIMAAVIRCVNCDRDLCVIHWHRRYFEVSADEKRYYRLRSKIIRLQSELDQAPLFPGA